jgi:hypothetical protein
VAAVLLAGCGGGGGKSGTDVVSLAKKRFADEKARGLDMSRGPCLGVIASGWVADVAHDPRQPVDDLPRNQCAAFRNGQAEHFVELDPSGALIRKE